MYEHRTAPLASNSVFVRRMLMHVLGALAILVATLLVGMAGYHWLEELTWLDSYLNAAMLRAGMGPVTELHTTSGKVFAGAYALFAGIVLLGALSLILAPALHRLLHRFHLEDDRRKHDAEQHPPAPYLRALSSYGWHCTLG